jgi:hypothetical protein
MPEELSIGQPDDVARADRHTQSGVPSTMACPECHGVLWEVKDEELVRFPLPGRSRVQ